MVAGTVLAFTVEPTPRFEVSARLFYLYNFANQHRPGSAPAATLPQSTQAGQAVWANFAASYRILPAVDVGINGYSFRQIAEDQTNGVAQKGTETTILSLGPSVMVTLDNADMLFANAYLPVIEHNTTDGFHLVFRWVHTFWGHAHHIGII